MAQTGFSFGRLLRSFGYAAKGIVASYSKNHVNIKIHTFVALTVILLGILLTISSMEWAILILCCGVVIAAEMFNTAIEALVDMVSPKWDSKAGLVKDISAGAVLILAITSVVIGLIIFLPKIIALLN
ncbi:diacylglycerol kinase family protein [Paludibacter jiangxiensis]|uniref:Diacylglycerol kinase (ATP) n=1 Tax=Paludibacter jiangxiensis TaxID=681398 RepID=A0A171AKC3_9BACT|nr:diacylglycerol kinase family protein [Paludibacter jiangxiensis]GAT63878.1 diacylglycerol kinase (ATP) [Paludibacter jiangxiensis]